MAGFEVVVRPVVFPDIRPAPAQPLRPTDPGDDPDKGFAILKSNAGKSISLSESFSGSTSTNQRSEIKRRVSKARVHQKNDDGTINKNNFIDIEVMDKAWMKGPPYPGIDDHFGGQGDPGFDSSAVQSAAKVIPEKIADNYAGVEEADNIEIKQKGIIKKNKRVAG